MNIIRLHLDHILYVKLKNKMVERNYPKLLFYFGLLGGVSYFWAFVISKIRSEIEEEI